MRNDLKTRAALLLAGIAIAAAACTRDDATTSAPPEPPTTEPLPPAATMNPADVAEVTSSYDCEGIRVDVVRDEVARANLAVDKIVKLERIANSVPPTYQDVGLTFTQSESGAALDDETGRSFACKPVAKPEPAAAAPK